MPTKTSAAKSAKTTRSAAAKKAYIFFNCDEEKSEKSMNVFYNHAVYKDTVASRKALWKKVESEIEAGKVSLAADQAAEVYTCVQFLRGRIVPCMDYETYVGNHSEEVLPVLPVHG